MTTRNIQGIEELAAAAERVAGSARNRQTRLSAEADAADANNAAVLANFAVAARAQNRRHLDDQADRHEELGQLNEVLGAPQPAPATPAGEPPLLTHGQGPAQPATPPAPTAVQPTVHPRRNFIAAPNGRDEWIGAILGLLLGLVIAYATMAFPDKEDGSVVSTVMIVLWFVVLAAVGFFTGGYLASRMNDRPQHPDHA